MRTKRKFNPLTGEFDLIVDITEVTTNHHVVINDNSDVNSMNYFTGKACKETVSVFNNTDIDRKIVFPNATQIIINGVVYNLINLTNAGYLPIFNHKHALIEFTKVQISKTECEVHITAINQVV